MFELVIYVIYDKYECLSSIIFNCYPIPQLNCKFDSLAVSLQRMILLVKFYQKNCREKFFHINKCKYASLKNVMELSICEGNGHLT